jgi:hypothetical protein
VLNGISQGEDTTLGLSLVTDVGVLLAHSNHDTALVVSQVASRTRDRRRAGNSGVGSILPMVAGTANNGG